MPDEEIIYRFQLSRVLPAGTDTAAMIALNRTLYERARDMGGYRMTSSAVPMSQDDWKRHYGPAWHVAPSPWDRWDSGNSGRDRGEWPNRCCLAGSRPSHYDLALRARCPWCPWDSGR
jgi:hypothetical protein